MFLIDDSTPADVTHGAGTHGLVPRDYATHPVGYSANIPPLSLPLIPRSEWSDRIKEKARLRSRLSDFRATCGPNGGRIPSLQQNSRTRYNPPRWGYCWSHSTTMGHMLTRAVMGQPYVKLSAFMVASIIQNYQDKGLWGAASLEFIKLNGQPPCDGPDGWPEDAVVRSLDTAAMRAHAARFKITSECADLQTAVYDRDLSIDQVMTCLLNNCPVVADYNWWGHSVILMDAVEVEPGSFGVKGLNSWGDEWGDVGEFTLRGGKVAPDGAASILTATAA